MPNLPNDDAEIRGIQTELDQGFDLREWLGFLWRHWKFIAAITSLTCLVGAVYVFTRTPLYTATAQVLLEPRSETVPGTQEAVANLVLDAAMLDNQMAIIRSTTLLRRVVERNHLASDPPLPAPSAKQHGVPDTSLIPRYLASLASPVLSLIGRSPAKEDDADPPPPASHTGGDGIPPNELRAIAALKGSLRVSHSRDEGHVINISLTADDPVKAAQIAKDITNAYLLDKLDTRLEAAKRASSWLSARLVGLRKQVHDSEDAVATFRADHGLVKSGGVTLNQQQLSKLNAKLIDARAALAQKEAQVEQLNAIEARGGGIQELPDVADAGDLATLRQQAADLSAQKADLLSRYGSAYPVVVNIGARLRDIRRSIETESRQQEAAIRNAYSLAQVRVASLEKSLREVTGQTNIDDATAVRLHELERTAAVDNTLFEAFLKDAKITREKSTFEPQDVRIITPALPPNAPSYPRKKRFMEITLFIGLLFGTGGAYAKEKLDAGFRMPDQIERELGLPLLASVKQMTARDVRLDGSAVEPHEIPGRRPLSRFSESIRSLRSGVRMTDVDQPPKVVQVTSTLPGEGKTTIALALATSAAVAKLKVLVVDADLRHPDATTFFGEPKGPGLVDVLLGEAEPKELIKLKEGSGYWALGAGKQTLNPADLLGSDRMRALVADFRESYDLVVIDTPPAGLVVDPIVVSRLSDKVVLVVGWGSTPREAVKRSVGMLSGHHKIAGIAFNRVNERQAKKFGRYGQSYYGQQYYKDYYTD